MATIVLPADALVVLVGASGAGKSTFARRHFRPTEILSSDAFRAMVADDERDQAASGAAFELLGLAARRRLQRGRLTVIDATSVRRRDRTALLAFARLAGRPAVAIVLDLPLADCLIRNRARPGRRVAPGIVEEQHAELRHSLALDGGLAAEGFATVVRLASPAAIDAVAIERAGPQARSDGR